MTQLTGLEQEAWEKRGSHSSFFGGHCEEASTYEPGGVAGGVGCKTMSSC